ncbi:transposase [Paraflavisolibacter sp. H34]|uniref:transposase n=1 Tax=Huijunlia imazamoxiresistens TaxID=3127457 RepID=UPI0030163AED
MLNIISNAVGVCSAALSKIKKVSQPVTKFVLHILPLWLGMNCRLTFMNMQRWGGRNEKSYRSMFSKTFDWFSFNYEVVKACFGNRKVIAVFDPSYISKSGKKTYGLAKFYSGTAGRALSGLEIGCLAFVGVSDHTALHALAVQSPTPASLHSKGKTLVDHYVRVLSDHVEQIKALTPYVVVDGYFMKKDFINPLLELGLQIITKTRSDANLRYLYKGKQKDRGRKRVCDGKIDTGRVDGRRLRCICSNKQRDVFAGDVYSVLLQRKVLAAFIYYKDPKTGQYKTTKKGKVKPEIVISTDTALTARTMEAYYDLRFQVEFLIRDSKSYAGLDDCQARGKEKLHNHFNIAMTAVSVAKAAYYLSLNRKERAGFSMADVKMIHMNELIANRIFSILDVDPSSEKYQQAYENCLNFGRLRA